MCAKETLQQYVVVSFVLIKHFLFALQNGHNLLKRVSQVTNAERNFFYLFSVQTYVG